MSRGPTNYWYRKALVVIVEALKEAKEQGLDEKETKKLVSSRYPFGPREYWPYKQWLLAQKRLLAAERLPEIAAPPPPIICFHPTCSATSDLTPQAELGGRLACPRHCSEEGAHV
jgi:hypothetical protein